MDSTPLGVSMLRKFQPHPKNGRPQKEGWWLVKYSSEARVDLTRFSETQIQQLSKEFGIVVAGEAEPLITAKDAMNNAIVLEQIWKRIHGA